MKVNTHRNCAYEMGHNVCIFYLYAFWRFLQWNCVFFSDCFFFNCKKQLQNFFLSRYFHLYLPRPKVLLKLVGRCRFGGGGASEKLSSLGSFFCEAEDYRKETLLSGGKGSLGRVWRLPGAHQPFQLLQLSSVLSSDEQALPPDASMDNSSPTRGAHQHMPGYAFLRSLSLI